MRNYSICYLDAQGLTTSSELLPFEDNNVATAYALIGAVRNPIVEVWKDNDLVIRLFRSSARVAQISSSTAGIAVETERHLAAAEWDNEGGASRQGQPLA